MSKARAAPTRARNLEKTRRKILEVAFVEVFAHGFQGVSVDDIVRKTSLTKGAFYHHFPTKLALGYALVEEIIRPMITERWIEPLNSYKDPLRGILAQMKKLIGGCSAAQLKLGCPLNNLVQEMAPIDERFKRHLQDTLDFWIVEIDRHLKRAKKEGFIRADVNTLHVAQFVVMTHEGFYGLLKGLDDPTVFGALLGSLERYFETLAV